MDNDPSLFKPPFRKKIAGSWDTGGCNITLLLALCFLSKSGSKCVEVFVTKFGWSREFPMDKKRDVHEALSLLFQRN